MVMTTYLSKDRLFGKREKPLRCRVVKLYITVLFSMSAPALAEDKFPGIFNYTHLIIQHIAVCGPITLCDSSFLTSLNLPLRDYPQRTGCPKCICKSSCLLQNSRYPCCPDFFFRNGAPSCRSVEATDNKRKDYFFSLIDSCPAEADNKLIEECSKTRPPAERLVLPPVSSREHNVLFWNRYCADCHNISNVQSWSLFFECKNPIDFNYLSSYEEITETADKQGCSIAFQGTQGRVCAPEHPKDLISQCNVTGNWENYDFSIDSACKSTLNSVYKNVFKNVFCYMCNPPSLAPRHLPKVFHCQHEKSPLQTLCDFFPRTNTFSPYKNIFCLLCSDASGEEYRVSSTFRRTADSTEVKHAITVNPIIVKQHYKRWERSRAVDFKTNSITNKVIPLSKTINITHVAIKSFAFSGINLCNSRILSEDMMNLGSSCSCEIGCTMSCCVDHALTYHDVTSCINSDYPPGLNENGGVSVINKCIASGANQYHAVHCGISALDDTDLLHALPVTDSQKGRSYKNMFCFLCNVEKGTLNERSVRDFIQSRVSPWKLLVFCKEFVNPDYFPTLNDFIIILKSMKCKFNIKADPSTRLDRCDNRKAEVSICNTTGLWVEEDIDIKRSCEETKHGSLSLTKGKYKNIFCQMCNPVAAVADHIIDFCRMSTSPLLVEACKGLPYVQMSSHYRNHFCAICNNDSTPRPQFDIFSSHRSFIAPSNIGRDLKRTIVEVRYYRTMFALSVYDKHPPRRSERYCLADQQLNEFQGECMNKTCFPGKILKNNSCVPLLQQTRNLRYVLYFWINHAGNRSLPLKLQTGRILIILQHLIRERIISIANISQHPRPLHVEEASFHSNKPCHATNASNFKVYTQITIFIPVLVNRTDVEMKLLNFSNSPHKVNLHGFNYEFSFTQDRYPRLFPFYLQKCVHNATPKLRRVDPVYRAVYVNDLLLCPQVLINPSEYTYTASTEILKIKGYTISLSRDEFLLNEDNSARVCVSKLNRISKTELGPVDADTLSLSILTVICILVSLVCLVVTFFIYCVFEPLRTLPGLNNMCLILSLFFAQLMTLIRPHALEVLSVALGISIALHYFWLSVFFWLHVCSFHMFRVFTGKIHTIKSEKGKRHTVIKYGTYAYGAPALIVASHLIVNLTLSNGTLTGYENRNGLVNNKTAFIVSIISPMMLICISNLIFFIVTVYRIRNTPHAQKNQRQSVDVWVYVKLFSLTGLTWIFQVVDAFLPLSFLSYVVAILNGLQGLFLFLSYVCNGRVLRLCCNRKTNNPSSNHSSGHVNSSITSTKL